MGLYGSPDLTKKYGDSTRYKEDNKKPHKRKPLLIVLIIFNILFIGLVGLTLENILTIVLIDCIIMFIYAIGNLILNLITKRSIKANFKTIIISFIVFNIASFAIGNGSNISGSFNKGIPDEDNKTLENSNISSQVYEEESTKLGTRLLPAKIGEVQEGNVTDILGLDCIIEIELLEVKKKEDALELTKDILTFVEMKDNQEYIFAKFRVKNIKNNSTKDIPFNFNMTNFSYSTGDYKKYSNSLALASGGILLEAVDLYEGAEHEGWICLIVEKDDIQPKAVFLDKVWFDL